MLANFPGELTLIIYLDTPFGPGKPANVAKEPFLLYREHTTFAVFSRSKRVAN